MNGIFLRALRLPAAVLYLTALSWIPIAHAQMEVVSSDPAVEAGHSGDCQRLHGDSVCAVKSAAKMQAGPASAHDPVIETVSAPRQSASITHSATSAFAPVSERGPPAPSR